MQIQKVNQNTRPTKQAFSRNNVNHSQDKENKDYNILKESAMEGLLLSGMAFVNKDSFINYKRITTKTPKANSMEDKILFGTMAACILITTVELVKAIKHYIDDKRNGLI